MRETSARNAKANANQVPKSGWRRVHFEEMAENIGDRVDNPSEAGVERYVGLEHLDPETLRIRRWGTPDEARRPNCASSQATSSSESAGRISGSWR